MASADADNVNTFADEVTNCLAIRGYAVRSARLAGGGTCRWKEKAATAARLPAWSSGTELYLVTVTPGMSMPTNPAPGPPGTLPRTPAIVTRSVLVSPPLTASGCVEPVRATALVTDPAAVVTVSRSATGRSDPLTRSETPIDGGSTIGRENVIWIHCPTGVSGLASVQ